MSGCFGCAGVSSGASGIPASLNRDVRGLSAHLSFILGLPTPVFPAHPGVALVELVNGPFPSPWNLHDGGHDS